MIKHFTSHKTFSKNSVLTHIEETFQMKANIVRLLRKIRLRDEESMMQCFFKFFPCVYIYKLDHLNQMIAWLIASQPIFFFRSLMAVLPNLLQVGESQPTIYESLSHFSNWKFPTFWETLKFLDGTLPKLPSMECKLRTQTCEANSSIRALYIHVHATKELGNRSFNISSL